jgi:RNA-directed DNA polymerase
VKVKRREVKSEKDLRDVLDSMYEASKNGNEPFYDLIELMTNRETIITAIHNIKTNKGRLTPGIDGKNINDILQMDENKLINLVRTCIGNYNPRPVRRVYINKSNGKKRPLGIPTIVDRIIQEIARMVLEPIAEGKFYDYSYGFRPYRSTEHAIAETLERIRRSKTYWVIEGDIKSFFDTINHNKLLAMLWNIGVKDKRFLMLIKKMLKAGVMEEGKWAESEEGTPQGGIISPLLANIYLNNFDWMIAKLYQQHPARFMAKHPDKTGLRIVNRKHKKCHLVRYADDWIILCETKEQAEKILKKVDKYFTHILKIQLSAEKTLISDITKNKISFLGFKIFAETSRLTGKTVGKAIPDMKRLNQKTQEVTKLIRKLDKIKPEVESDPTRHRATLIEQINSKIVGLAEYYKISNCSHIYKSLDQRIYNQAWKTWRGINGNKGLWNDFTIPANAVANRTDRHKTRKDRIFCIKVDGIYVGLTKFQFTKSTMAMKFNNKMTPYTEKGRILYERKSGTKLPLIRGTYYTELDLWYSHLAYKETKNPLRNFEYKMNREYALLRDKGKCKCCGINIIKGTLHCHHVKPRLPLEQVNKVNNLATVCLKCHKLIHSKTALEADSKTHKKILKYREQLVKPTA